MDEIITGISKQLNTTFGDGFEIYDRDVEQGLNEPCFLILILKPDLSPLLGRRALKTNPFDIHYFPPDGGDNRNMITVGETMLEALEYITLSNGDLLRGTHMSYEIIDGVLHFYVEYNHTVNRAVKDDPMDTLDVNTNVTEGQ